MSEIGNLLLALFAGGLFGSLVLTRVARVVARRVGLVDKPDGRRKIHERVIPVAGGIAVFATSAVILILLGLVSGHAVAEEFARHSREMLGLGLGCLAICIIGVADDARGLRGRYKLLGQIAACFIVVLTGVEVRAFAVFGREVELGWLTIPFTVLFLLGAINSLNLLDGMDGLLGTVGTIVAVAIAILAVMANHPLEACVAIVLAGALLGFLRYNYPPASIFLGDAGSMLIGLVIGTLAIRSSLKGPATVALAAPTALLIIPIFDTAAALIRRKLTGRSIFSTDRGHIHHCLLRTGLSRPAILLIVGGLCVLTFAGALASIAYQNESIAVFSAMAVVSILIATRLFGHAELMLILHSGRHLAKSFLGTPRDGRRLEVRLQGSAGWSDLWARLTSHAEMLNLKSMSMDVNAPAHHEGYHARWSRQSPTTGEVPNFWSAVIPLSAYGQVVGQVTIIGAADGEPMWRKLAILTDVTDDTESVLSQSSPVSVSRAPTTRLEPFVPAGSI